MSVRRTAYAIAAVGAIVVFAFPSGASGVPFISTQAQCKDKATVGKGEHICTARFLLNDSRFPSDLETHANFHARTALGTVTLEWYDQLLQLQARFVCRSPGLYVSVSTPFGTSVEGGPADLSTYPNCTRNVRSSAYFATGWQTLVVRATAEECWANDNSRTVCPFHGYLVLNPPGRF